MRNLVAVLRDLPPLLDSDIDCRVPVLTALSDAGSNAPPLPVVVCVSVCLILAGRAWSKVHLSTKGVDKSTPRQEQ